MSFCNSSNRFFLRLLKNILSKKMMKVKVQDVRDHFLVERRQMINSRRSRNRNVRCTAFVKQMYTK